MCIPLPTLHVSVRIVLLALLMHLGAGHVLAKDRIWKERGWGGGGRFTAMAVDPSDPARIYVGSDVAGFYISTDRGQHFTLHGAGLGGFAVAAIAVSPESPSTVLFLTDAGIYVSQDRGETLTRVSAKVRYRERFFGSNLLLRFENEWYAGTDTDGVFQIKRNPDGSWKEKPLFGLQGKKVTSLAVLRGRLYAATDEGVFSHDGEIWKHTSDGFAPKARDIVDMAAHPGGKLYAVENKSGLYLFDESNRRWDRRGPKASALPSQSGPASFKALAISPTNPNIVYLGTDPQTWPHLLLRSEDSGSAWSLVKRFTLTGVHENWAKDLESIEQMVFSPDGREAYLADWWNLWHSVDGGTSWLQLHQGLQNTVVNDIQVHPANPAILYAAADDNGLMVSTDSGRTWRRKMKGVVDGHAAAVRISSKNPNLAYLLINPWKAQDAPGIKSFYLYKSTDGGETWNSLRFQDKLKVLDKTWADGRSTNLVIDPASDDVVYVGSNGYGIYRVDATQPANTQQPVSAQNISAALPTPYLKGHGAIWINPRNNKIILAATQEGGIFRTEDAGATWKLAGGAKSFVFSLAADPANPDVLYAAAAEKRLFKSTDGGMTWQTITLPGDRPPHVAASVVTVVPGKAGAGSTLVVGTLGYDHKAGDGIFISTDGGATFARAPQTLPAVGVLALVPSPDPEGLVLGGFNGLGVYELGGK